MRGQGGDAELGRWVWGWQGRTKRVVLRKWTKPRAEPVDRDTASRQQQQVMDGLVSWSLFERIFFF